MDVEAAGAMLDGSAISEVQAMEVHGEAAVPAVMDADVTGAGLGSSVLGEDEAMAADVAATPRVAADAEAMAVKAAPTALVWMPPKAREAELARRAQARNWTFSRAATFVDAVPADLRTDAEVAAQIGAPVLGQQREPEALAAQPRPEQLQQSAGQLRRAALEQRLQAAGTVNEQLRQWCATAGARIASPVSLAEAAAPARRVHRQRSGQAGMAPTVDEWVAAVNAATPVAAVSRPAVVRRRRTGAQRRRQQMQRESSCADTMGVIADDCSGVPEERLESLAELRTAEEREWHPPGGCKLMWEAWQRAGTHGWLLEAVKGAYGVRWKQGESADSVEDFDGGARFDKQGAVHGNYDSCRTCPGAGKLGDDLQRQAEANIIEWFSAEMGMTEKEFARVISPFGVVPKANGGIRPVHDLTVSGFNDKQCEWPFQLVSVEAVLMDMVPGCSVATRDWAHGFHNVVVAEDLRPLLGFRCPVTGRLGRYRCYPMGLKHAPAVFCAVSEEFVRIAHAELVQQGVRVWRPGHDGRAAPSMDDPLGRILLAHELDAVREQERTVGAQRRHADGRGRWSVTIFAYVDDHPMIAEDDAMMERLFEVMDEVAADLGVTFKAAKDVGRPSSAAAGQGLTDMDGQGLRRTVALGALFSSDSDGECRMTLPVEKAVKYREAVLEMRERYGGQTQVPLAVLDSFAGRLAWAARLCRWGQAFLGSAYDALGGTGHIRRRERRGHMVEVDPALWDVDVPFWLDFLEMVAKGEWRGISQWQLLPAKADALRLANFTAATDASTSWGAGGVFGFEVFSHKWPEEDLGRHISWLELQAILIAVRKWGPSWAGQTILLETDNSAADAYVRKGGGRVLDGRLMMKEMAMLCLRYNIELRSEHLAGVLNVAPDGASRGRVDTRTADFMLGPKEFAALNSVPHTVDAACDVEGLTRQPGCLSHFYPGARSFLRYSVEAAGERIWCFPPFHMVGEFMEAVEAAWREDPSTSCTMVVPEYETAKWFRRARRRRNPIWREVARLGRDATVWMGECERLRLYAARAQKRAGTLKEDLLALTFP